MYKTNFTCDLLNPPYLDLSVAQVWLDLANHTKLLLRVRSRDGGGHDDVVTDLPVDRGSHTLPVAGLEGVDDTENLGRVTAGRGRVHHREADFLVWVDDEHGPDGEGDALLVYVIQVLLVDHVIQEGNFAVSVGDDGELHVS